MSIPTLDDTRWAVTGGGAESGNQSNPLSGLKDTGWPDHTKPTGKNLNWILRKIHAWFQWLTSLFTTPLWRWLPAASGVLIGGATLDTSNGTVVAGGVASGLAYIPLDVPEGTVIDQIGITSLGDAAHDLVVSIAEMQGDGTVTFNVVSFTRTAQAATWSKFTAAVGPYTVPAGSTGKSAFMGIVWSGGTTLRVQTIGYRHSAWGTTP